MTLHCISLTYPLQTICPVENPLNYSAVVSGHPSQTGALQIKNDSGYTVWLLGVTVLYDHIRSLLKLIFSITFHYDKGKSQSIQAFGSFFLHHCLGLFLPQVVCGLCVRSCCLFYRD